MQNFKVSFFKLNREEDDKGNMVATSKEYVGSVVLDDSHVDENTSLLALAYRRASPTMQLCDRVEVTRV